ncbi:rifamycin-inactivating phosphotransferase [Dactylosporangium sp. CS-047395]|uniref:rifamycin-inactivating phosphotransferase n=1 Tax=Dactylosporangium sp. CS-047395 TaxID=3239936 RepID=UPI003D8AA1EF
MSVQYVVGLDAVDGSRGADVGGKGANLGELRRIEGIRVPGGFCVTTAAFRLMLAGGLATGADRRRAIEATPIPEEVAAAITATVDPGAAYAVRSSATAEDLPTASFAGQQDSYLNVTGPDAVLEHVRRCWGSLFTDRAVAYRRQQGIDDRTVHMAVVVQRMVDAHSAGVMFTADPVTGNRRVTNVDAVLGLGEDLVSGRVTPDVYQVRDGAIVASSVAGERPALSDEQVVALERLGRRIEAHFGRPQDIEWCLDGDGFQIVQSRPITTLFPVPARADSNNHVYLSVGHQQMMTEAMRPLGISFWQMTTPVPMAVAGGRLFVDVTARVADPASRAALVDLIGKGDPLTGDALRSVLDRDFIPTVPAEVPPPPIAGGAPDPIDPDPAVVAELIAASEASVAAAAREIRTKSGEALLDFIRADLQELRRLLFDRRSHQVFMSAMEATWWLNERLEIWLGEKNAADVLTQSVPHNITSEMGLDLLDVADAIRPHPEVVAFLEASGPLDELPKVPGGAEARDAIEGWLDRYGMRCIGEIDITRPRWREQPSMLVPLILGNVRNFAPGESRRRFEQGRLEALEWERVLLERLRALADGAAKAEETKRKIDLVRTFIGYREYPKYGMISRYFLYKQALLGLGLPEPEDIYFLEFDELYDVVRTGRVDDELVRRRREEFRTFEGLRSPRVLTSDGETITGSYRRDDVPAGALTGLPVSAGTVEGRARVILDMTQADLAPGDILVTPHTDPSWTPLFVAAAGLVTEVGGLMTHGAVIAREYGLPAVVGVVDATRLIRDGERIRVHGTEGYVELLS